MNTFVPVRPDEGNCMLRPNPDTTAVADADLADTILNNPKKTEEEEKEMSNSIFTKDNLILIGLVVVVIILVVFVIWMIYSNYKENQSLEQEVMPNARMQHLQRMHRPMQRHMAYGPPQQQYTSQQPTNQPTADTATTSRQPNQQPTVDTTSQQPTTDTATTSQQPSQQPTADTTTSQQPTADTTNMEEPTVSFNPNVDEQEVDNSLLSHQEKIDEEREQQPTEEVVTTLE